MTQKSYTELQRAYGGKGKWDPENQEMTWFLENWLLRCPTIVPEEGTILADYMRQKFGGSQAS